MNASVVPNTIYRHFKGDYYLIVCVAKKEENGELVVVYRSLDGSDTVWSRPLSEFRSKVPADKVNPTGQEHRFERVGNMKNVLKDVPTSQLIFELTRRPDNPLVLQDVEEFAKRIVQTEYSIIRHVNTYVDEENTVKEVFPVANYDNYESARNVLLFNKYPNTYRLYKRVWIDLTDNE